MKTMCEGFREFEFALTDALLKQLIECFEDMGTSELNDENTSTIPNGQGVYQLFFNNELVYIGKTDSEAGLQPRLCRHAEKIKARCNLDTAAVRFKAIQVLVFSAMELESLLIKHYSAINRKPIWNKSGFGSNDPGRKRDHSAVKDDHFDALYSIDIDIEIEVDYEVGVNALRALEAIKQKLPYLLRFDKRNLPKTELESCQPLELQRIGTVREHIRNVLLHLGEGWQATGLPGYIIVYKENRSYAHGDVIAVT